MQPLAVSAQPDGDPKSRTFAVLICANPGGVKVFVDPSS
jgi:hypothetical protein